MGELHRVGEQVEQDLFDLRSVGVKREVARRQLDLERELLLLYERLDLLRDLGHNVAERHVVEMQRHPAGFDLREVENVVDQRKQMLSCALDSLEALLLPRREVAVIRSSISDAYPMSALIGVLSSWDMLARNSDFSRFAFSSSRDCHW